VSAVLAERPILGAFGALAHEYAAVGIPTFPVDGASKRPLVRNWPKITLYATRHHLQKWSQADAFAFVPGSVGITVLDIDTADEAFLRAQIDKYGQPGAIVRTASGKWHCYYSNSGEGERIRPWGPDVPVDLKGGRGQIIAAGSVTPTGVYEFVHGGLESLRSLPPMQVSVGLRSREKSASQRAPGQLLREGDGRNSALYKQMLLSVEQCTDPQTLLEAARAYSAEAFADPLPDYEIASVAKSVWRTHSEGRNFVARARLRSEQTILLRSGPMSQLESLGSADALALFVILQKRYGGLEQFPIANEAHRDDWTLDLSLMRLRRARQSLLQLGLVAAVKAASSGGGAALFRWGSKVS
jgi:hypothetical protein